MRKLRPIFLASFFFSAHLALVSYVNSSMLGSFLTPKATGFVFTLAALLSLFLVRRAARFVARHGVIRYILTVIGITGTLLFLIGLFSNSAIAVLLFIPYFAISTLVFYGFDLLLEHFSPAGATGNTRGLYLSLNTFAWVGMPAFVGFLQQHYGFGIIYFFAGFGAFSALAVLLLGERGYKDPTYTHVSPSQVFHTIWHQKNVRGAIIVNFLLQIFYVWMVIYAPLYLVKTLGFSWESIGIVLSVMLLPFLLFQYPTGRIADKFSNERELIAAGFLVMGMATLIFSLIDGISIVAIALVLFLTRVGASIVEASVESYFFKQVNDSDSATIAVYRYMYPFAYIIGPLLAIILLGWSMYAVLFFILGILMLAASGFALTLRDIPKES